MDNERSIRQLVEQVTGRPGFMKAIGTRVLSAEAGSVSMALDRHADLLQANGYFHGGVISALADHAAGGAVTTALPAGRFALTVDLHLNFLAPAKGDVLVAHAKAVKTGNVIGVARVELTT
ncbi:MAG: PaaI family thioesterase, partial [bacterium]